MGCGSSRIDEIARMYGEPSEFDTCSTMISSRDNRGEPDGSDVRSESEYKEPSSSDLHIHRTQNDTSDIKSGGKKSHLPHPVKGHQANLDISDSSGSSNPSTNSSTSSTDEVVSVRKKRQSQQSHHQARYHNNGLKFPPSPHPSKKTSTSLKPTHAQPSSSAAISGSDCSHVNFKPLVKGKYPLAVRKESRSKNKGHRISGTFKKY